MTRSASMRFLGVSADAPPRRLLGLPDGPLTPAQIDTALERQRQRIVRHPAADDPSAKGLLAYIESAAAFLRLHPGTAPPSVKSGSAGRPRPDAVKMTEFDREVLEAIGESGGFNRGSQMRLAALASRHGVRAEGVIKVVAGLSAAMREGKIDGNNLSPSGAAPNMPGLVAWQSDASAWNRGAPSRVSSAIERFDESLAREVAGDTPARLMRLVLVFVGVACIAGWMLILVLRPATPAAPPAPAPILSPEQTVAEAARRESPPEAPVEAVDRPDVTRPAKWPKPPRMQGAAPPTASRDALREAARAPERLAALGRKLQLAANRPSAADEREWAYLQGLFAQCWPLLDPASRAAAIEASVAALRPIENDEVAKALLQPWSVDRALADEPLGSWRGAWNAGLLAEVAARPSSTASIAAQAIDKLDAVVSRRAVVRGKGSSIFESAAGAWLDKAAAPLAIAAAVDPDAPDRWERWSEAQAAIRSGAALEAAYLDAIGATLASGIDLVAVGAGADLLGRLVQTVDWTERSPDQERARESITLWFTDELIPAPRLWVLTSLLDLDYDAAWFIPELVVAPEASREARGEMLEKILATWPAASGAASASGGIVVDARLLGRWRDLVERARTTAESDDLGRLRGAVAFARLGAAAQAFATGDADTAQSILGDLERDLQQPPDLRAAPIRAAGVASGSDGEFAAAYEAAGRDEAKRKDELRALRSRPAASDLGPRDAEVLVTEAIRASPLEVRQLAQTVIQERFSVGPVTLQELLDQLPNAVQNEQTAQFLELVTGERLPDARSGYFMRSARLAVIRRLLALEPSDRHAMDALAESLASSYADRGRLARVGFEEPPPDIAVDAMLSRLVQQWRLRAGSIFLSEPFPASLEELDRRRAVRLRLAEGAIQRAVAEQVSLLELASTIAVAEKPSIRQQVAVLLEESTDRRSRAGSVFEQLLDGERAWVRLISLLLESSTPAKDGAA